MMEWFLICFFATADGLSVKIGRCKGNLYTKKRSIQTGNPQKIELLGVIQCEDEKDMLKREKALHRKFKPHRTQGEWFMVIPEISEYIQEFADDELGQQILEDGREADIKAQRKAQRERYRSDPEYRKASREASRERYRSDPEYREARREAKRKADRERYRRDPKVREKQNKARRERYRSDPEYRERLKDPKVREARREADRERYRGDPEYRKKRSAYARKYRQRKKAERLAESSQKPEQLHQKLNQRNTRKPTQ